MDEELRKQLDAAEEQRRQEREEKEAERAKTEREQEELQRAFARLVDDVFRPALGEVVEDLRERGYEAEAEFSDLSVNFSVKRPDQRPSSKVSFRLLSEGINLHVSQYLKGGTVSGGRGTWALDEVTEDRVQEVCVNVAAEHILGAHRDAPHSRQW